MSYVQASPHLITQLLVSLRLCQRRGRACFPAPCCHALLLPHGKDSKNALQGLGLKTGQHGQQAL